MNHNEPVNGIHSHRNTASKSLSASIPDLAIINALREVIIYQLHS